MRSLPRPTLPALVLAGVAGSMVLVAGCGPRDAGEAATDAAAPSAAADSGARRPARDAAPSVDSGTGAGDALAIIDAHLHTRFSGQPYPLSGIPDTREELLREMREAGVVGGVSHTDSAGLGWWPDLAAEGIIHCRGVGTTVDAAAIEEALASGRYRCIKIYLGYVPRYPTDPAYEPVYRLAARFGVPVVFHTGDTSTADALVKYAHPLDIDEVAVRHRDVTFVIAHAGNPWFESAAEVTYKNPNVALEASAILAGDLDSLDPEVVETLMVEPLHRLFLYVEDPSRILFGSDWPVTDIPSYVAAYRRAIPREHWQAVFHDNAVRVFGLSDP